MDVWILLNAKFILTLITVCDFNSSAYHQHALWFNHVVSVLPTYWHFPVYENHVFLLTLCCWFGHYVIQSFCLFCHYLV